MHDTPSLPLKRDGPTWLLLASAGLALLLGIVMVIAVERYRDAGIVFYPSLALVNYSLRGPMLQPVALGVIAASLVAWWAHGRHRQRLWGYVAALGWAIAGVLLLFSLSPYHPVARLSVDQSVYQLATYHEARTPDLFLLFACDPTGLVCRQVSAYAPFDVGSGRAVTGTPTLVTDASTGAILVRIDSYTIGVYTPGK